MIWNKVILVLWVQISAADVENNGTYNHLLETNKNSSDRPYSISYSSKEPLMYKYGEWFKIRVEGDCSDAVFLEEPWPGLEEAFPYGVPRHGWICNADKLEVLDDER